jgi:hypothetical protein
MSSETAAQGVEEGGTTKTPNIQARSQSLGRR